MALRLKLAKVAPGRAFHAALVELPAKASLPWHSHDFWESALIVEGSGRHAIGRWEAGAQVAPGDVLLIRPDDRHAFAADADRPLTFINVAFPESEWQQLARLAGAEGALATYRELAGPPAFRPDRSERIRLEQAFREALGDFASGSGKGALFSFLALLLERLPRFLGNAGGDRATGAGPEWLPAALASMATPAALRAGVVELRRRAGVSAAHLSRTVRRELGCTPTELVNELRLERAAMLLLTTNASVIDVATDSGFENLSYFYRLFRRRYGTAPGSYRARSRGGIDRPLRRDTRGLPLG